MRRGHYKENYRQLICLTDSVPVVVWSCVLVALLLIAPWVLSKYFLAVLVSIMVTAVGVLGLNLLTGTAGLISLGHAGFLAVGAYTAGILGTKFGWPMLATIPTAGAVAALFGALVGVPSLRLRGLYLAITTLAFHAIINHVILSADMLTGGSEGISLRAPAIAGFSLSGERGFYYVALAFVIGFIFITLNILRSRVGRALLAIREHDIAATAMGINLTRYKLLAFMVSAFYAGVAGALFAYYVRFINVESFSFLVSIEVLSMLIVGGLGSVSGALLGTTLIIMLNESLGFLFRAVGFLIGVFGLQFGTVGETLAFEMKGFVYGLIIVLFLRFEPDGLIGRWRDIKRYFTNWPFSF